MQLSCSDAQIMQSTAVESSARSKKILNPLLSILYLLKGKKGKGKKGKGKVLAFSCAQRATDRQVACRQESSDHQQQVVDTLICQQEQDRSTSGPEVEAQQLAPLFTTKPQPGTNTNATWKWNNYYAQLYQLQITT
jgi:hypothetical protein